MLVMRYTSSLRSGSIAEYIQEDLGRHFASFLSNEDITAYSVLHQKRRRLYHDIVL